MARKLWTKKIAVLGVAVCLAAGAAWIVTQGLRWDASLVAGESESDKLIVHEWGTFTSFAGSNGVKLEFRPLVDSDLPPFVLDRWTNDGQLDPRFALSGSKRSVKSFQRMETPVIYFYSSVERDVRVKVGFPQGLITEFFPPVTSHRPVPILSFEPESQAVANSTVEWSRVDIIPATSLTTRVADPEVARGVESRILKSLPPRVNGDDHYARARETDSAMLHVHRPKDPSNEYRPSGDFFERFLFYRGVGTFDLPLAVRAEGGGKFIVKNAGERPIRSLFLVNVSGNDVKFARSEQVAGMQEHEMFLPESAGSIDELAESVVAALVEEKLYEKEARAMVATWRTSWFGEQGTRLFYLLPRPMTDELLPLDIEPRPDELVRVLVGRLEMMTPEDESRMTEVVRRTALDRKALERVAAIKSTDAASVRVPLPNSIKNLGRLAEPMLARVKETAQDELVRREAEILLAELVAALNAASN